MDRTVAYILSTNYAGSHFCSLLVGSHSQALHIGEVKRLRKDVQKKHICTLCGDEPCPVFRGIDAKNVDGLYERIAANTEDRHSLYVDASKKLEWAKRFLHRTDLRRIYIHLIRDPRSLVRRWELGCNTPERAREQKWMLIRKSPKLFFRLAAARPRSVYLHKWFHQNRNITSFIRRHKLEHIVVTYRDLAVNTVKSLERLMPALQLTVEPGQEAYWEHEHHGSQKRQYEWVKEKGANFFDTRWREVLSETEQKDIQHHPAINRYLQSIGVSFDDDGLAVAGLNDE